MDVHVCGSPYAVVLEFKLLHNAVQVMEGYPPWRGGRTPVPFFGFIKAVHVAEGVIHPPVDCLTAVLTFRYGHRITKK